MNKTFNAEVQALQSLCDKHGGFRVVAKAIGVNDQSLYQILTGVRLPSGATKGIGPKIRRLLDSRYPGWNEAGAATKTALPSKPSAEANLLAAAYDTIPLENVLGRARAHSGAMNAILKEIPPETSSR